MAIYTLVALGALGLARLRAVNRHQVDFRYYRLYNSGTQPDQLQLLNRHVQNLFEVPPLFYAVVILTYASEQVTLSSVILAWGFVVLRFAHAWVHLSTNFVPRRFKIFAASILVLAGQWILLLVALLRQITVQ